ncbi:hypothetical protein [Pontibacillus salipaludis]|uniref:Uncharacterized protein n=1 Tax=Pontibacillus salipaludis TaxID=1697394 RepID=A0ABQ1Q0Q2_9BACI|nr:hypothetical protein [Pontibacillus salipaludis]GGD09503.1 hypothetical protein GCM10011389_16280 [Pontibacillus salipaludis]
MARVDGELAQVRPDSAQVVEKWLKLGGPVQVRPKATQAFWPRSTSPGQRADPPKKPQKNRLNAQPVYRL